MPPSRPSQSVPDDILVNMDVEFQNGLSTNQVEEAIAVIGKEIREGISAIRKVFIEALAIRKVIAK
ncbi:MAG: hypothetical protein K9L59_07395 [Desulfobacterales bacterium]|nr:hypothetical protein [Desulfobacterales bacterium]